MSKVLKVIKVEEGSLAEKIGLQRDDSILTCNGMSAYSVERFNTALGLAIRDNCKMVSLEIQRGDNLYKLRMNPSEDLGCRYVEIEAVQRRQESAVSLPVYGSGYGMARILCNIAEVLGWLLIVAGIIWGMVNLNIKYLNLVSLLPVIWQVAGGLSMVFGAQITRATVDNADHTGEMLAILKKLAARR